MNTTFTNYAEKKAKQFLNLLQGYTKGIRMTAILILLLMGVNNAWAVNHTGGYVYFLKPSTWTESTVMMFIGRDQWEHDYTTVFTMTKVTNTDNLYCYTMPKYDNANYVTFANASNAWGSGSWYSENRKNASHYTNVYKNYAFTANSYYVVVPASTSNDAEITINKKSSAADLNLTTQANVYGSTDGGSTYASMAAAGTVSVSGYYMSNSSTASTRSAVSSTSSQAYASTTLAPGSTATFKATASTGYKFVGWFDAASGGTAVSTDATYTFKYDISYIGKTLYARFKKITECTLRFGVQGIGGSVEATAGGVEITSPHTADYGTNITLTATAADKYKFSKWVNGNGAQVSTDNPYTHTLTANTTIQAVFTNTDVLYLKLNNYWKNDVNNGVWFAAYFYKNGSGDNYWVKMKNENPCGGSDYYKVQIPDGNWTNVIFCRMNNECHDLKWDCRWDQTQNLTIPTDGKNLFTINTNEKGGDGNNNSGAKGSWSTHTPQNYEPVVFNVTVPPGTPNCYIIGDWDGWSQFTEMTKVDDTHYTVTMYDVCKNSLHYKYCYGPSWGCEEVKNTDIPTEAIQDRTYHANDEVAAWISYYIVGYNGDWDTWNNGYKFDINGNLHVNLATITEHEFKIKSSTQKLYTTDSQDGEKNKFNRSHTSEYIPTTDAPHNLRLNVDIKGYYDFHFNPVNKHLIIDFPVKGYQLQINMTDGTKYTSNAVDNAGDIFSFFAPGTTDNTLRGTVELYRDGNKQCTIPAASFDTSRVYVAKLNSARNGIDNIAPYTGNYYIRTDGAHGGWNNYKTNNDNKMTYFVPREREKYSYYWVAALPQADRNESNGVVNVKACVGNDYNENLAVMLGGDKFTDGYGNVTIKDPSDQKREKINVRFGYNPKTNHFERAMLTGSGNMPNFLNITDPEGKIFKDQNGNTALTEANTDSKFTDVSNWVYETNIWVHPEDDGATVCLTATAYNGSINSLFGFEADGVTPKQETIIGKNSGEPREMRVVYDFKTNRMIMAWIPGDITITKEQSLQADVLFIRHENDGVPQLKITDDGKIKDIQSQFFALELENDANKQGGNKEHAYWISLPFDCVVGSISGVPGYMETWGIQRYNGEKRAEIGWFKETYTFWEWLTQDDVMKAGEGYVLSFDKKAATWNTYDVHEKDENGNTISTTQKSLLRLYFPSTKTGYLFQENMNLTTKYDNQPCKITRDNRHLQDGNWKIIATTSYYNAQVKEGEIDNTEGAEYLSEFPKFRYTYWRNPDNRNDWKYTAEQGGTDAEYKSFHSYMVQYAGTITWKALNESIMPAGLAARRNSDSKATNITTRLVIADAEEVQHDQTFVALDEKGTTTFDQNLDLNKIFNSGKANIYTLSEGIPFAGNALPMGEAIVPVGVQIATEGEYTFRMPDGTEGMVVELVDYETNTRTNLLLSDYIVTLPKGTSENRFALHIQPQKDVVTSLENIGEGVNNGEAVNKYLIDGKLIIRTAEGVFDAQGRKL